MNSFYEAQAVLKSQGGGIGHVQTSDGILDFQVTNPTTLNSRGATNPEQLFAAGFASCFESALLFVAAHSKVSVRSSQVIGKVAIGNDDRNHFKISVALEIELPNTPAQQAQELVQKAQEAWPFAKMHQAGIDVQIELKKTANSTESNSTQATETNGASEDTTVECDPSDQFSG